MTTAIVRRSGSNLGGQLSSLRRAGKVRAAFHSGHARPVVKRFHRLSVRKPPRFSIGEKERSRSSRMASDWVFSARFAMAARTATSMCISRPIRSASDHGSRRHIGFQPYQCGDNSPIPGADRRTAIARSWISRPARMSDSACSGAAVISLQCRRAFCAVHQQIEYRLQIRSRLALSSIHMLCIAYYHDSLGARLSYQCGDARHAQFSRRWSLGLVERLRARRRQRKRGDRLRLGRERSYSVRAAESETVSIRQQGYIHP